MIEVIGAVLAVEEGMVRWWVLGHRHASLYYQFVGLIIDFERRGPSRT